MCVAFYVVFSLYLKSNLRKCILENVIEFDSNGIGTRCKKLNHSLFFALSSSSCSLMCFRIG